MARHQRGYRRDRFTYMGVSGCKIPRLKTEIDRAGIPLLTEGKEKASRPAPSEPTPPPPVASQITKRV
ncbi:septum formation inhibitor [Klebsiella pneumoniae]|uniref:Septum formation inhibitor n=1 Tax=Klebsiella pneumoniae TaxID=573 RepID=A0A377XD31_KLEPN|nr:septum formation inhibitor [Klebsiella pneumoniae]